MNYLETSPETKKMLATATDRELQNQMYLTLRGIEIQQEESVSKLTTIAGVALFFLFVNIASIVLAIYFLYNYSRE